MGVGKVATVAFVALCSFAATMVLLMYVEYIANISKPRPPTAIIVWPNIDQKVIDRANKSYIPVISENLIGSGVQISPTLGITCFHVLNPGDTAKANGISLDDRLAGVSTKDDIVFFHTKKRDVPEIPIAQRVIIGEILISVSNGGGNSGIMRYYWAAHSTEDTLRVGRFGTPTIKGESGSALFNLQGELVGIMKISETHYGVATPFNRIATLKAKIETQTAP